MFLNYLKVALRTFAANKLYSFINIFALSVAMACGIVAYVNYDFGHSYDRFHENRDDLYVFRSLAAADRGETRLGITPRPLGPALVRDFPAITGMSRIISSWKPLRVDEKVLNNRIYYVEPDFLGMFTFPVVKGNPRAIEERSRIVLTRETAERYFGNADAVGQVVTTQADGGVTQSYVVGAVIETPPSNSSLQFDGLLAFSGIENAARDDEDWTRWSHETVVLVQEPGLLEKIKEKLPEYASRQVASDPAYPISALYVESMNDVAGNTRELINDIFKEGMHPAAIFGPTITSLLLLITACFNFMNTSLAFSAVRLKEVGIRKVLGSVRSQLVLQFIGENLLLCLISLLIAIGLAEVIVPAYGSLWPEWDLTLSYAENWGLFLFLILLLIGMSVLSGAYPSLYVSRFSPASILAGRQRFGGKNWLMQGILVFQFSLSVMTILTGVVFTSNADFLESIDLGFDTKQTIAVPLQGTGSFDALINRARQHPKVQAAEGARHVISYKQSNVDARSGEAERRIALLKGGVDYLSVMNLRLVQGRGFDRALPTDKDEAVVVTRKLVGEFGWEEPIGQRMIVEDKAFRVIGVVDDFYNRSVWSPLQPSAFLVAQPEEFRYLLVRADIPSLQEVNEFLQQTWREVAPNVPYEGFYGSETIAGALRVSSSIRLIFLYVSGVAIVIAAMGLFALSSLIIVRRTKEIGIRKVLGAPVFHIVQLLNRQVAMVLLVSGILAAVGGAFSIGIFLDSLYAYHVELQLWHFAVAAGIVVLIGLLTVSSQVYRVATSNPVESLKYE